MSAAAAGFDYATTSPDFAVRSMAFEPTAHVDEARLRTLMDIPPATNILALDLVALSNKIVADPWVARASVGRELPNKLTVQVQEHVPAAVVLDRGLFLVDADGKPFKRLEAGERQDLAVISGVALQVDDEDTSDRDAKLALALDALAQWDQKARPRLSEINVGPHRDLTLFTAESGTQLRFGRGDFSARLARYDGIRIALGPHAERLAVVHLDHSIDEKRGAKVVARFVRDEDGEQLLARAHAARETPPKNEAISDDGDTISGRTGRQRRIPRAH